MTGKLTGICSGYLYVSFCLFMCNFVFYLPPTPRNDDAPLFSQSTRSARIAARRTQMSGGLKLLIVFISSLS